jgi:hypothetical protein
MQSGKLDEAVKQAEAALSLAPATDAELQEQLFALKLHLSTLTGKGGKPDVKEAPIKAAQAAVQNILSSKLSGKVAESLVLEASKRLEAKDMAVPESNLAMTALLAWAATLSGNGEFAEVLSERASASKQMRPRLWVDLGCLYRRHQLDTLSDDLSEAAVKVRQEALQKLEQLVDGFVHINDIEGIHATCRYAATAAH